MVNDQCVAVDVFDTDSVYSLINLVDDGLRDQLLEASQKRPELFGVDEAALLEQLGKPSNLDILLRESFWNEYDRAQAEGGRMVPAKVYTGICLKETYQRCVRNPSRLAYLVCRPLNRTASLQAAYHRGMECVQRIFDLPLYDGEGKLNLKVAELQLKTFNLVDIRLHGAPTQRIEEKRMSLNFNSSDKELGHIAIDGTMEQITQRIRELEKRDLISRNIPVVELKPILPEEGEVIEPYKEVT